MKPTDSDILAVNQLMSLWGHVLDQREWDRLDEILTENAVYDARVFGFEASGREEIKAMLRDGEHALAHHATNVLVLETPGEGLKVVSKGMGILAGGIVSSVTYTDDVVCEDGRWRISSRLLEEVGGS